jgi:hypothetical protein
MVFTRNLFSSDTWQLRTFTPIQWWKFVFFLLGSLYTVSVLRITSVFISRQKVHKRGVLDQESDTLTTRPAAPQSGESKFVCFWKFIVSEKSSRGAPVHVEITRFKITLQRLSYYLNHCKKTDTDSRMANRLSNNCKNLDFTDKILVFYPKTRILTQKLPFWVKILDFTNRNWDFGSKSKILIP